MRISIAGPLAGSALLVALAVPAPAQSVALPLRGQGEIELPDTVRDIWQGSVLLQADSSVKVVFLDAGTPRTILAGRWWMADRHTAELAVLSLLGNAQARGTGAIRFRPDGSVENLEARGLAGGRAFSLQFDNGTSVAIAGPVRADSRRLETGAAPRPQRPLDEFPWAGGWALLDVSRRGEGRMQEADGLEERFDRARLSLGDNDEFVLVLDGDTRAEFAGVWSGDPRDRPIHLELREAMGAKVGGVGRAWIRERSWDRDWSFDRVELDGWNDAGGDAFTLYFEAERP